MPEIEQFAARMYLIAKGVREGVDAKMRRVALACDQAVVLATPVDSGRARSNWIVRLGEAAEGENTDFPAGKDGSTGAAAAAQAMEEAARVIARYDGSSGRTIHITNNLPYIGRLNDGYSAQAPAGFVEEAVKAAAQAVGEGRLIVSNG